MEIDGDHIAQIDVFERVGIDIQQHLAAAHISNAWRVVLYSSDELDIVHDNCVKNTTLILPKLKFKSDRCVVIDANYLRRSGAISINMRSGSPVLIHSRETARNRPWGY